MDLQEQERLRETIIELEATISDEEAAHQKTLRMLKTAQQENDRLQNPLPGDLKGQAAAWVAVNEALEDVGLLSFYSADGTGRGRAVEFIGHLGAELGKLREIVAIVNRFKNVSRGYKADGSDELPEDTTDDAIEEYEAELLEKLFDATDALKEQA